LRQAAEPPTSIDGFPGRKRPFGPPKSGLERNFSKRWIPARGLLKDKDQHEDQDKHHDQNEDDNDDERHGDHDYDHDLEHNDCEDDDDDDDDNDVLEGIEEALSKRLRLRVLAQEFRNNFVLRKQLFQRGLADGAP
jgi:hypothetical protein